MMLQAENISFAHRTCQILKNIDLSIRSGELLVIIGPNGAGKSTLLNILANELISDTSRIVFKKKDLSSWKPRILAQHKAKFSQEFNKDIGLTSQEIVLMGRYPYFDATPHAEDWEVVSRVMQITEVYHLRNRLYNALSGGEKQRVHLARVLAQVDNKHKEKLAFFDEPLNNLDIRHQYQVLEALKNFTQQGNSVVIVLHDLNLAAEFADRLLLLKEGQIKAIGNPEEIFKKEIISGAYNFPCTICKNPVNDCPMIIFRKHTQKSF